MDKVYIIFEKDLNANTQTIYDVYANKAKAKATVDQLNASVVDNDSIDYVLDSYEVVN